jgi:hypothetical protein
MQNKYVGDTGDFGKFYLLNNLISNKFQLGVNWYLVDLVEKNNDGKHTSYLNKENTYSEQFNRADSVLYKKIQSALKPGNRSVNYLQKLEVLPAKTLFFSEFLNYDSREEWFKKSCIQLKKADIIFCDPDNGFEIKSCGQRQRKSVKYTFYDEVQKYYSEGKSILVYQHVTRNGNLETQKEKRKDALSSILKISKKSIETFYFGKGTGRFYFLISHDEHLSTFKERIEYIREECQSLIRIL